MRPASASRSRPPATPAGVIVGLDSFLDIGIRAPGVRRPNAPVDEGGVPGQVARATGA